LTKPNSNKSTETNSAARLLPWWWISAGAFLFYALTLNHWISLNSLRTVARVSDWLSHPDPGRPLAWLVFAPLRLLPEAWIPILLNLVTAVAAALVLGQLARSVAILRVDVVPMDAMRKKTSEASNYTGPLAWLPPVIAVVALGLQGGFWEHATSASGEIFSVLCFVFAWRAVLEFRLAREEKWLFRAALVFAVGMADNWWLLGYLPVFIAAVIWAKGFSPFLEVRFLARMLGWALLGMSLYLLVPALLAFGTAESPWDFGAAVKTYLGAQKGGLQTLRAPVFRLLVLTGLLPFLLLAVRWRSHSVQLADDTRHGVFFTKLSGHFIHALFLIVALWLTLQPIITPYQLSLNPPLLVYHYPWALVVGYGTAYLLVFGLRRGNRSPGRWPARTAICLLGVLSSLLVWKNWADLRLTNGSALRELARQLYADLPAGNTTVLSDDPRFLLLARAAQPKSSPAKNPRLVDTRMLPLADYHQRLQREHPGRWPALPPFVTNAVSAAAIVHALSHVATNEPVVYLHPSSGLFFERFEATPRGWAQQLYFRTGEPAQSPDFNHLNAVWEQRWTNHLARQAEQIAVSRQRQVFWAQPSLKALKLAGRGNETAQFLAVAYAKMLNHFGVERACRGDVEAAARWYERAIAFHPDNIAAQINWEYAQRRQHGDTNRLTLEWIRENLFRPQAGSLNWAELVSHNGPVDEPTTLLHVGRMYLTAGNPHQARERFARSSELAPDWTAPKLAQAQCLNLIGQPAEAAAKTAEIIASGSVDALPGLALAQLLQVRAVALRRLGQTNEAATFIEEFINKHQAAAEVIAAAADLFSTAGQFQAEVQWRSRLVERDPKRIDWLVAKGHAELRADQYGPALKTLDAVLMLDPGNDSARLSRGIAALGDDQVDTAQRDFQTLLQSSEYVASALFGLGGVAWRQRDTNAIIGYYEAFLTNRVAVSQQTALATQRLNEVRNE
jgi:tetratricopeptide (TPR) repeat protein